MTREDGQHAKPAAPFSLKYVDLSQAAFFPWTLLVFCKIQIT